MTEQRGLPSVTNGAPVWALLAAAVAGPYSGQAAGLPAIQPTGLAAEVVLAENEAPAAPATTAPDHQTRAPLAELSAALAAARAGLEQLSKAAARASHASQELSTARQENERLRGQVAALQQTSETAGAWIAELTKGAKDATAEAKRVETEPAAVHQQRAELSTGLARAQAARDQTAAEARTTEAALSTKVETLTKPAEQSASEIFRLRTALADSEHRLETSTRSDTEAHLADLQTKVQAAEADNNRLDEHTNGTSRLIFTLGAALHGAMVSGGGPARGNQVIDGNRLVVEGQHTRLFGIDAFEPSQTCLDQQGKSWHCGTVAQAALAEVVQGGALACIVVTDEPNEGYIARCAGRDGIDLGGYLVRAGLALADPQAGKVYLADQAIAKAAAAGAWGGTFSPPWSWRSKQRDKMQLRIGALEPR
jgi:endonuclease YncB( thermonuclease family)